MKVVLPWIALILSGLAVAVPAEATQRVLTATIVGLSGIAANAETTLFEMSTVPAATGCKGANNGWFAFSPTTITDAQTRKNFVAYLLTAKTAGMSVLIVYDDAGGNCDPIGYPAPYEIILQ